MGKPAVDNKWIRQRYRAFNKRFFANALPPLKALKIKKIKDGRGAVCLKTSDLAATSLLSGEPPNAAFLIEFQAFLYEWPTLLPATIIHEMIHIKLWPLVCNHEEPLWSEEIKRLENLGVGKELI